MKNPECVLKSGSLLGEGALWDPAAEVLWWLDITDRMIHRYDPRLGSNQTWHTPSDIGSLALRKSGGLIVAMGWGFFFFDPASGGFELIAEPEAGILENRFNDGKPDRQGRFWAGTLHEGESKPSGSLYRLDPDLSWEMLVSGVIASNALAFGAQSEVVYFGDSQRKTVWAFDFDADDGALTNRRVFLSLGPKDGSPDGAAVDSDGCYWLAQPDAWCVTRYDPRGRRDIVIDLPVQRPTCVALGGTDLKTLFITSARWGISERELAQQPLAGGLFAVTVDTPGLPDAAFDR